MGAQKEADSSCAGTYVQGSQSTTPDSKIHATEPHADMEAQKGEESAYVCDDVEHADMANVDVEHADVEHAHVPEHADMADADVEHADMADAVGEHADVEHAHVPEHADLAVADVEHAPLLGHSDSACDGSMYDGTRHGMEEWGCMDVMDAKGNKISREEVESKAHVNVKRVRGYRHWEDPKHPLFENKAALILDLNGLLLTTVNSGRGEIAPSYFNLMKLCHWDRKGVDLAVKADAETFLDWCFQYFDVFVWTCCMHQKAMQLLQACFPNQYTMFKRGYSQEDCHKEGDFTVDKLRNGKPVFYKKLARFWEEHQPTYTSANTLLVDDSEYKCVWNPPGTYLIVKKLAEQGKAEMLTYLTENVCKWLEKWLAAEDRTSFTIQRQLERSPDFESQQVIRYWKGKYVGV